MLCAAQSIVTRWADARLACGLLSVSEPLLIVTRWADARLACGPVSGGRSRLISSRGAWGARCGRSRLVGLSSAGGSRLVCPSSAGRSRPVRSRSVGLSSDGRSRLVKSWLVKSRGVSLLLVGALLMLACGGLAACRSGGSTTASTSGVTAGASGAAAGASNSIANGPGPPANEVRVEVSDVGYDTEASSSFVQLDDQAGRRSVQIAIGDDEAHTITLELHGLKAPRPLTGELLREVIAQTGNAVDRVEITAVMDGVYYARIVLDRGHYSIDCRPSDAIALALGSNAPIYIAGPLMHPVTADASADSAPVTASNFGVTVQQLTPDLAAYFGIPSDGGVVVADFGGAAGKAGLHRGDIVIAAGGRAIHTPEDFARASAAAGAPFGLTIRRGAATRTLTIAATATQGR